MNYEIRHSYMMLSMIRRLIVILMLLVSGAGGLYAQQTPSPFADFVEPAFPFITTTVDARALGPAFPERNLAVRCVVVQLGHEAYACFDTDLLRMAMSWHGDFLALTTMAQVSYHEFGNKQNALPRILGEPIVGTGIYPGWMGEPPTFTDPRPAGLDADGVGRGPIAADQGRWNGLYLAGERVVFSYTVRGTDIYEQPSSVQVDDQVGLVRTFRLGEVLRPLTLVVGEVRDGVAASVEGEKALVMEGSEQDTVTAVVVSQLPGEATLRVTDNRYITLHLPAGTSASAFSITAWRGAMTDLNRFEQMPGATPLANFTSGGPARWPEVVETQGHVAPDTSAFVVDELTLPIPNPWKRNVRVAGVDFFEDGRAAVVTFEGDVWLVSGIDEGLRALRWKRYASGLYEPLTLKVVEGAIYVYGRAQITRLHDLNGDDEADYYENFSNLYIQSGETREFVLDMAVRPEGGFYLSQGAALDFGPRLAPTLMTGFRAGSPHGGTVMAIAPDGRSMRVVATGFREPFLGVHPHTGRLTASDQQGHFVPSTPVYVVQEDGYYGVPATAQRSDGPAIIPPITWIPHQVDPSGAGQVWITSDRMGPLNGALVHLSYGKPGLFQIYLDSTQQALQGGVVELPVRVPTPAMEGAVHPQDGQLYLAGFKIYDSRAERISALMRLRYTGQPYLLPRAVRTGEQGILLHFDTKLDRTTATQPSKYQVRRWTYQRTEDYGSGHYKMDGTPGQEHLPVLAAHLSQDEKAVLLVLPDMKPVMQMEVGFALTTEAGVPVQDVVHLTVHHVDPLDLEREGFENLAEAPQAERRVTTVPGRDEAPASATRGSQLYQRVGCMSCHSTDGTTQGTSGPTFRGLYGTTRTFTDGRTRIADDAYLMQSILQPASEVVEGFAVEMPSYVGVLSEAEVASLVLFIKSLADQ